MTDGPTQSDDDDAADARVSDRVRGRRLYEDRKWRDAFDALYRADTTAPLDADDLAALGWSAALIGRDDVLLSAFERLYHMHLDAGRGSAAARAAFWVGFRLFAAGEPGRASGWMSRAQRAVECEGDDCVERGFLMLPTIHRDLATGNNDGAHDVAAEAAALGDRFGEKDLSALARNLQGRALIRRGQVREGIALLDELMVAASGDELSPLVTGLVYCSVIASCHQVYALDRAREWTDVLSQWCAGQSQLVTFSGTCLVHRSEIMQLGGAWQEAVEEARRVATRFGESNDDSSAGDARYQEGEILRLRGQHEAAEEAYVAASAHGAEVQPGLALLRLAQGRADAARAALGRVLGTTVAPLARARFLPAQVEVALARGDLGEARAAAEELQQIASEFDTDVLDAMAGHARGAVLLSAGDARGAAPLLQHAMDLWQRVGAPYIAARIRVLLGRACGELGDDDGFRLALDSARSVFEQLGAGADLAHLEALGRAAASASPSPQSASSHGLTPRELEVLALVASGSTNKAIAKTLFVSERTIDRHVSNIFTKLDLSSRSAATAYAYENGLTRPARDRAE